MKIGFIGLGNMGTSILKAVSKVADTQLLLSNHKEQKIQQLAEEVGGRVLSNQELVLEADVVFLGVKPHLLESVLLEVRESILEKNPQAVFISMAAGVTLADLSTYLPVENWIRIMPNTSVAIGKGMTTFSTEKEENSLLLQELMQYAGQVKEVPENCIDIATAIAGCGPAFVYEFIESLTQAGIEGGLTATDARFLACHTLIGASEMVLESRKHPAQLRDEVSSPGGATIAGLSSLKEKGFQTATISAVRHALKRTKKLGKKK